MAYVSNQQPPPDKERKRREELLRVPTWEESRESEARRLRESLTAAVERAKPGTRRWTVAVTALSAELLLRFRQSPEKGIADLATAIRMLSKAEERNPAPGGTGDADTTEARLTTVQRRERQFARATATVRRFISKIGAGRGVEAGGAEDAARVALLVECLEEWEVAKRAKKRFSRSGGWGIDLGWVLDINVLRRRLAGMAAAPARVRVHALHALGGSLAAADGPGAGYEDMAAAVALLPRTAGWGANSGQRGLKAEQIANRSEVTADAAFCAIAAGRPVEAIELLETGRGVLWDQLLHATIRAEVGTVDPGLVRRMDRVCRDLERPARYEQRDVLGWTAAHPDAPFAVVVRLWGLAVRLTGKRAARRVRRWTRAAQRAQGLQPDATFQLVSFGDIKPAAAEGPVVAVVLSRFGCYALVVTAEEDAPGVVPLPALTLQAVRRNARGYLTALNVGLGRTREEDIQETLYWLWETVVAPVFAALELPGRSGGSEDDDVPRLWWCPSGPLAVLPLHAAEPRPVEGDTSAGAAALVVSSYTPTVRSLISARNARDLRQNSNDPGREGDGDERGRLLLVSAGGPAGHQRLPATARFRDFLSSLLCEDGLTTLDGPQATIENVKRELGRHSRVHFDCHGRQDLVSPERTGLVLHDQDLTIADLVEVRAERPEFAFLAACSTAAVHRSDLDAMISVTSVLHYRGYLSVIGTMSPVLDSSTERVAMAVYEQLAAPQCDAQPVSLPVSTAALLHHAVHQERRRRPRHPSTWVPFIHVGI